MQPWIWIVIAVVIVVVAVLVVGLLLGRRRRVSLTAPPPTKPGTEVPPPKAGYRAGGSISFSAGSGTGTAIKPRPQTPPVPPVPEPEPEPSAEGPTALAAEPVAGQDGASAGGSTAPVAEPVPAEAADDQAAVDQAAVDQAAAGEAAVGEAAVDQAAAGEAAVGEAGALAAESATPVEELTRPSAQQVAETEPAVAETIVTVGEPIERADESATAEIPRVQDPVTEEIPDIVPSGPGPDADAGPEVGAPTGTSVKVGAEEIEPSAGRLSRLRGRLSRSQNAFGRSLLGLLGAGVLDEDSWTEVEDTLLMADLGSASAAEITVTLRAAVAAHGVTDAISARSMLRTVLIDAVGTQADRSVRALPHDGHPAIILVVGVNGTGKTTTTGKLARVLVADGRSVVLGAADTFRAAAAEQLVTWGQRAGATVIRGDAGADPAAVAFDAVKHGIDQGADAVLIDTAGRLHTKTGLMDELGKVKRVIAKQASVDEVLLVLDATTGQNGLVQARVFAEVVDVTGIVLTKLDGTAKGGIVVAVQRSLGVPVKLVGLGEGPDDLAPFEPEAFVDALLGD